MEKQNRMRELVEILNEAANSYYNEDTEIMSNYEYDELYDELVSLEEETGIILPNSPTISAGYEAVSKLVKVSHKHPALSLNKTKDRESLVSWLNGKKGVLSWKMDGLTVVATYENGKLTNAVTRGNGYIGEDVTHNAEHFIGLPKRVKHKGNFIVRGEAIMTQTEFQRINSEIPDSLPKYKNPRNLASATVRLFDAEESSKRQIIFSAFDLVEIDDDRSEFNSKAYQLGWLANNGFAVVEHKVVTPETVVDCIAEFENKLVNNDFPSDGLVLIFDDESYGKSLGITGKFPRNGIAFKWKDETVDSIIRSILWSASRTGLLNPVAIFDPVEIEGTTVSRASIHNVSIAKSLKLGIGSTVSVYKANLIIPQIAKTVKSTGETEIPIVCPVCGGATRIIDNDDIQTLYCTNDLCAAKNIGRFTHFVTRDCANIVGFSKEKLTRFIESGFINEFADIYHLSKFKDDIVEMDGFGEKSYENIMSAIEESRNIKFSALLNSIGIQGIGKDMAKQISKHFGENALSKFMLYIENKQDFSMIDGIGEVINGNIYQWFNNDTMNTMFKNLLKELYVSDDAVVTATSSIAGKTFVITGSVNIFKNRDELKARIESLGGKTANSVSSKTDYLINNDTQSNSSKNKKAKELGVKIISEDEFVKMTK